MDSEIIVTSVVIVIIIFVIWWLATRKKEGFDSATTVILDPSKRDSSVVLDTYNDQIGKKYPLCILKTSKGNGQPDTVAIDNLWTLANLRYDGRICRCNLPLGGIH